MEYGPDARIVPKLSAFEGSRKPANKNSHAVPMQQIKNRKVLNFRLPISRSKLLNSGQSTNDPTITSPRVSNVAWHVINRQNSPSTSTLSMSSARDSCNLDVSAVIYKRKITIVITFVIGAPENHDCVRA
mmetsp:Transcript_19260/g.27452  ORF Transcript_19260/g.27452 Transcript_19260/m.27452 type:complete len:130 (-) Transcript_19260:172-561(-)